MCVHVFMDTDEDFSAGVLLDIAYSGVPELSIPGL